MSSPAPSSSTKLTRIPRIALAGNPNSGKTTLFNALTGLRYKVANYPGVTVERKEGSVAVLSTDSNEISEVKIVDLPGIYSLSGQAEDERISTSLLLGELQNEQRPEVIIAVVDASNLERNLYLTTQLIDLGQPVIVALTMIDAAKEHGISVRTELLSRALGVPVVAVVARKKFGLDQLMREVAKALNQKSADGLIIPTHKQFTWLPVCSPYRDAAEELGTLQAKQREYPTGFATLLLGTRLLAEEEPPFSVEITKRLAFWKQELESKGLDPSSLEATARYQFINWVVKSAVVIETPGAKSRIFGKIDRVLTHRVWGLVIFVMIMAVIFQAIFAWASAPMDLIEGLVAYIGNLISSILPEGVLRSLIVDGIIAGVGSVLVFIPQIAILFAFIGILEDSGYLARAAFIMDRVMRQVGLQGRSFIPMLSSFACAIPGIMATRSIPSFADRMVTILVAPLMSCSARLPVYTLLIAAFIPDRHVVWGMLSLQGVVLLALYLLGIFGAAFVAWVLKLTAFRGKPALFVMEMPPFRRPSLRMLARNVFDRILLFVQGAGSVILACSVILWALASFPEGKVSDSYAGQIGHFMEPAIAPLGWNWEVGVGILASFAAREVFISSLATVYNLETSGDTATSLVSTLQAKYAAGTFTLAAALSLLVFYVFACQCMSTLAVCKRETGGWRWPIFMFGYMSILAYGAAYITYRFALASGW